MSEIIDIEETLHFVEFGIVVLKVGNKKRYMKPRATNNKDFPFELFEISTEEKAKLGIIEESEHTENQDSEVSIEESLPEDRVPQMSEEEKEAWRKEQEEKSKKLTLSGDPSTVRAARDILEKEMSKRKSASELEEENEDLKSKLGLIAEKAFEKKKQELGCSDSEIDTPDKLLAWEKGKTGKGEGSPSGSAPLNSFQLGEKQKNGSYSSVEEMINDLRDRAEVFRGTPQGNQAEKILNQLLQKGLAGQKETNQLFKQYQPPIPELIEKDGLKVPANKDEGDLAQWTRIRRRRTKIERDEKGVVAQ